ncbi:MAG TPA: sigma factor-like helix-turn-helix DNA-binding protein [Anaeromyxobacter sp.]|nr:sigma factor-like helix-turn-helix DNA-binding protein [Anaeromyxobacter sp.]
MSEAKRSEPQVRSDHEAQDDGEELLLGPADDLAEEADGTADGEIDAKRGRRRSMTMSRKEIARELRRQRAFGIVDPELEATVREIEASRPRSRADCANGPRPCMFIACKHHLYLDVNPATGSIKLNFPDREVWELDETCALDVADKGGITLEEVGSIMNLTRERIRQVETRGLAKLRTIAEDEPRSPSCKADDLLD